MKKYLLGMIAIIAAISSFTFSEAKVSAYEDMKHYQTLTGKKRSFKDGGYYRSGVYTIGRKYYNDGTYMGRIQLRAFATTEDMKNIYWMGYPIGAQGKVVCRDESDARTGEVLTWAPLSSSGSNMTLADAAFNWKDWTNIVGLAVKVITNKLTGVVEVSRSDTSIATIRIERPSGLENMNLTSSQTADKDVQDKALGFTTEFVVKLNGEFSKVLTSGNVKYHMYDNSSYGWVDVWGGNTYTYHYLW